MAKVNLTNIGTLTPPSSAIAALNDNVTEIARAMDTMLSRDGEGPNQMEAELDMNSQKILNVADPETGHDAVNLESMQSAIAGALYEGATVLIEGDSTIRTDLANGAAGYGAELVAYDEDQTIKDWIDNLDVDAFPFQPPDVTALEKSISAALSNAIPVTWYATDAQLAIDATTATQAAIDYAASSGAKTVYFPAGRVYFFDSASASLDPGVADITFMGDGAHASVLDFDEGDIGGSILDRKNLFRNTDDVVKGCIQFRDLHFRGTWEESLYTNGLGGATMLLDHYNEIIIEKCRFTNLKSYVMANEFIRNVRVMGCTFDKCARDMCRFRSSFNVQIVANRFSHCDDDAVALHCNSGATGSDVREGIVVSANIFEDCPAIQILGGRMVNVNNNLLRRCKQNGIFVYTSSGAAAEGDNGMFGVSICNNQIFDQLGTDPFSTAVSQVIAVYGRNAEAGSASSSIIPGSNNTGTGAFVLPWNHRNSAHTGTVDSVAPPYFVRIQDNTIARTLPSVGAYSTWGYGETYVGDGPQDPAVTDAALRPTNGIIVGGQLRKTIISGNIISHVANGIGFNADPLSNFGCDDMLISHNLFSDYTSTGIRFPTPGAVRAINMLVDTNIFDGDPYHISTNRGSGGTWVADTEPSVISNVSMSGVRLSRNKIRNVARVVDNGGSSAIHLNNNVLRCEPSTTGFSTSNRGIGNCPNAGTQYDYEMVDSDPTSATYGQVLNTPVKEAGAQPSAGLYVRGHFVHAVSGTSVLGWYRLTTGSAHVAGTDWKTVALT